MKRCNEDSWPESDQEDRIVPCCKGTILIPGKCWAASCEEVHYVSQPPSHRPGPLIYTVASNPIPKGVLFRAIFTASSRGEFDYYIHHGPHAGLKSVCGTSRRKFGTAKVANGDNQWHTLTTIGFFETTAEIEPPYWCWFDPCYEVTLSGATFPVFGATLVVELVRGPGVSDVGS